MVSTMHHYSSFTCEIRRLSTTVYETARSKSNTSPSSNLLQLFCRSQTQYRHGSRPCYWACLRFITLLGAAFIITASLASGAAVNGGGVGGPGGIDGPLGGPGGISSDYSGPRFSAEPLFWVEFSNSSGAELTCEATGDAPLTLTWVSADDPREPVSQVAGLRTFTDEGTLVLPPFRSEDYRQDVHAVIYRCVATNAIGSITSRDVHVSAVVDYTYEPRVYDGFVVRGNTAVLKCHVPSYIRQYTNVDAWIRDDGFTINASGNKEDRYTVLQSGELLVYKTSKDDEKRSYRCRTRHLLTGKIAVSSSHGKVTVTESHVSSAPKATLFFPEVKAKLGAHVDLPCVAQGHPPPKYSWYLEDEDGNRRKLTDSDRLQTSNGVVTIRALRTTDEGRYVCIARNSAGEERTESVLTVIVPLQARLIPQEQRVEIGHEAVFNCSIQGQPVSLVTWRKDSQQLLADGRIQLLDSDRVLRIQSIRREDAGIYQCFAENDRDAAQAVALLRLDDMSPTMVEGFEEKFVMPGDTFELRCKAKGSPLPEVSWRIDGDHLYKSERHKISSRQNAHETEAVLQVADARVEDSGEYTCVASNDIGTAVEHSARVNIEGEAFVRPMRNASVVSGTDLAIKCPYGGYPVGPITWLKSGMVLPVNYRQSVDNKGVLHVRQTHKPNDEGEYTCTIQGGRDRDSSTATTYISVVVAPQIDDHFFPDIIKVEEGTRSRLMCSVSKGDPPLRFRWLKNGLQMRNNADRQIESNEDSSIIKFQRVKFSDKGMYTCFVSNDAASVSRTVELIVSVAPRWKVEPRNASAVIGQSAILHCSCDGFPAPSVTWKKGVGVEPRNFSYIHYNFRNHHLINGSLLIRELEEADQGYYLCEAHNGIGAGISKLVYLTVHVPPHFDTKHRSYNVAKGQGVTLECAASGDRPMHYVWEKNQAAALNESRYVVETKETKSALFISAASREDSAMFSCRAHNNYGQETALIQLVVQEPPGAPTSLLVRNQTSRTADLHWQIPYNGNSVITRYIIEYKLKKDTWPEGPSTKVHKVVVAGGDNHQTRLSNLQPVTHYEIRMSAVNALGNGPHSTTAALATSEEAPSAAPSSVSVHTTGSQSLKVSWKAPPKEQQNGVIKGYRVGYRIAYTEGSYSFKQVEPPVDTTYLTNLQRMTKYAIVVQAYNRAGAGPASDEVIAATLETSPPTSPSIRVSPVSISALRVSWELSPKDNNGQVTEYTLHYSFEEGQWSKVVLDAASAQTYVLQSLRCGTVYQLYMTASNSLGTGEPGPRAVARTKGTPPIRPLLERFISTNSSCITLYLGAWKDSAAAALQAQATCPVTRFVIQYRSKERNSWVVLSDALSTTSSKTIEHLSPSREYQISVTAFSDAGSTQADFIVQTTDFSTVGQDTSTIYRDSKLYMQEQNILLYSTLNHHRAMAHEHGGSTFARVTGASCNGGGPNGGLAETELYSTPHRTSVGNATATLNNTRNTNANCMPTWSHEYQAAPTHGSSGGAISSVGGVGATLTSGVESLGQWAAGSEIPLEDSHSVYA
ncbi:Down syndrome cell adhesion molecule-like protein Dscam2 isoform X3 [Varroa destructor]|uniref:Down syndrome cell adhesion molecule-like protein Dscam2 n=1 Tax=Varroa destructor TaxID=109461 RepID=A0A7M7MDW1_VARDE|nr:Down syndrome cell adhesion molecule-like protein Dscam2 isoform X3 [Varroa destructor]